MRKAVSIMSFLVVVVASRAPADIPRPALAVKNARAELEEGRQIELDARIQYSGELLLFDSPEAMRLKLVYPYCISAGLAPTLDNGEAAGLAGKRVQVRGTLLRYKASPDNPDKISTFSVVDGMSFKNWCFGPYVLRIEKLTIVP